MKYQKHMISLMFGDSVSPNPMVFPNPRSHGEVRTPSGEWHLAPVHVLLECLGSRKKEKTPKKKVLRVDLEGNTWKWWWLESMDISIGCWGYCYMLIPNMTQASNICRVLWQFSGSRLQFGGHRRGENAVLKGVYNCIWLVVSNIFYVPLYMG